ncbi:hypothetical protein PO878_03920 [Iamia majanohamensis]|uniref:Uncharacterized protein n=1 Tax=Iamia majanohamensis TaxID=467976 RepID=A0AAF0BWI6_9ACTN|nr:hypothetical protein [Iamia majanohamensis]WCO67870.1 hypothetical protein PO878_03920 [Iamia majanohamensis]
MARSKSANLSIVINGDATGASKAMRQVEVDTDALGDKVKGAAVDMARAWAAVEGIQFLRGATEEAASLEQAQGQVNYVFGESAGKVQEFGDQAVDSIAQSEKSALVAAGTFGNLITGMGVGADQAADMSIALVRLASDMAATADVPVDQALNALQSGLAGEQEPLKRFGVLLNQASVEAKAMELGLMGAGEELSNSARAQATYVLILEQTKNMQGAIGREGETATVKTMRATAAIEEAKVELGTNFIPVMKAAADVTRVFAVAFGALPGPLQVGAVALAGVVLLGPKLVTAYRAAGVSMTNFRLGLMGVTQQGAGAANAIGGVVGRVGASPAAMGAAALGVGALAIALIEMSDGAKLADKNAQTLIDTANSMDKSLDEVFRENLARTLSGLESDLELPFGGLESALDSAGVTATQTAEALTGTGAEFEAFKEQVSRALAEAGKSGQIQPTIRNLDALRDASNKAGSQQEQLTRTQGALGVEISETTGDTDENTSSTEKNTAAQERRHAALQRQTNAWRNAREQTEKAYDKWQEQVSAEEALRNAQDQSAEAQADLAEARRAATGDSDEYRGALEQIEDAEDGVGDAQRGVQDAMEGLADAQRGVRDAQEGVQDALRGVRDAEEGLADAQEGVREAQVNLTDARADAAEKIRDLAAAAREAALNESGADIAARRAKEELDRVMRDDSATMLDKDEARQEYDEAVAAAAAARDERAQADRDAADAARAGVEGDEGVIAARQALADASVGVRDAQEALAASHRGVRDAEEALMQSHRGVRDAAQGVREAEDQVAEAQKRVGDASRNAAKILDDAKKVVVDAENRAAEAALNEAAMAGAATAAHDGTVAGIQRHRAELLRLAEQLDPNNPLRQRIAALVDELGGVLAPYQRNGPPPAIPFNDGSGVTDYYQQAGLAAQGGRIGGQVGGERSGNLLDKMGGLIINAPMTVNGSDIEVQRETERRQRKFLDDAAKVLTGG